MAAAWETIPGMVISSELIPARAGWSREIARGEVLRIVDLEGRQAVDFLCYNAADYEDRYAGKPFLLLDWQKQLVRDLFGWTRKADGLRRFREQCQKPTQGFWSIERFLNHSKRINHN